MAVLAFFVFDPQKYHRHKDLCKGLCSASWSPVLRGKQLNVRHYTQTVQPNSFLPSMLIGMIDFYHFIPLSLILTLPGDHKVSAKQNLLASLSRTLFI